MLTSQEKRARVVYRMAKPFQAYAIIALVVSFLLFAAPLLSSFATLFAMIIVALIIVCTIFIILLDPKFREMVGDMQEFTDKLVEASNTVCQYAIFVVVIAGVFAVLSLISALPNRTHIKWKRAIISNAIIIAICLLLAILYLNVEVVS